MSASKNRIDKEAGAAVSPENKPTFLRSARRAWQMVFVRFRFILVFLIAFLVVGNWSLLQNWWEKWTRKAVDETRKPVSPDTEYFCPMCPGVLSDWPTKCPVCNMALVRRKKGEATPLPDGVLTRMQFSPYRIQLAGIRTAPVEYRTLVHEINLPGVIESVPASPSILRMRSEILAKDTPFVAEGQEVEIVCDALAGRSPFVGTVRSVSVTSRGSLLPLTIEIRNGPPEVRPGMTASARILVAATRLGWFQNSLGIASRSELAMHMTLETICAPTPVPHALAAPILPWAIRETAAHLGLVLAVPTLAVVDTGSRKIVYVESGVGMFDGVEVSTGPRFGDYLPILNGLRAGQNVATTGAFLIDAETRLNPSVAASYFGSTGGGDAAPAKPAVPNSDRGEIQEALSKLSAADRALAIKQKLCPVTDEPLGSMGVPPAVKLGDRTVFLCCKGCEAELRRNPAAYLSKLPVR